jgi:hypothetical protein
MANLTNINPVALAPAAQPTTNTCTAGSGTDTAPLAFGGKYLFIWNNTGAGSATVKLDDPISQAPVSFTTFDPDVTLVVPNGQRRVQRVDANRFRDPVTGLCSFTYTVAVTTMTLEIHGPE